MPYSRVRLLAVLAAAGLAACSDPQPGMPDSTPVTECNDTIDNDGDMSTDYPADPGCDSALDPDEANPPVAMCSDGRDNDADGHTDYPDDPGCFTSLQNSEADDCPNGPTCPACSNDVDDDGDGLVDYPEDPGCGAASEGDEFEVNPNACGPNLIVTLLQTQLVTGTLPDMPSNLTGGATCGGAGGEVAYQLSLTDPSVLVATTDLPGTAVDTVLYLRTDCVDEGTQLACNDDIGTGNTASTITAILSPGTYYLVVDARNAGMGGAFELQVDLLAGEGEPCAMQSDCGPGLQCRIPQGETEMICAQPVCNDPDDEDGDGLGGYPDDPGCDSPGDFDETDDCPGGPSCPDCADDIDNDGDAMIDYPDDTDCGSASQPVEGCGVESDPIFVLASTPVMDDLSGLTDDIDVSCDATTGGAERVFFVTLPAMESITFDTNGSTADTVLALLASDCSPASELDCDDESGATSGASLLTFPNLAAGTYALVASHYGSTFPTGAYNLNVAGTIAPGGACDGPFAMAGVFTCPTDYTCNGSICVGTLACNNGVDDDGDSFADFPADPGCASATDTDELDDCPTGPSCPACGNGVDDDGDTFTDFPDDDGCTSASEDDETEPVCIAESDPVVTVTASPYMGTVVGLTDDFDPGCNGTPPNLDQIHLLDLPALSTITLDTIGSVTDTVLAVYPPTCASPPLACNDDTAGNGDSILTFTDLPAGTYPVLVENYGGTFPPDTYNLNIVGTIAPMGACDVPLAMSGALTCPTGYGCVGGVCAPTSECLTSSDEDGDGFPGFPTDPGCSSATDPDESDDCPAGPMCPACSNAIDDDLDGQIDYPADTGCLSAGGLTEQAICTMETSPTIPIQIPVYAGTTVGTGNDYTPCSSGSGSTAEERLYSLTLPVPVQTLTIDTAGSTLDTVLSFTDDACGVLACDDDGAGAADSLITRTNVSPGLYGVLVDGFSSSGSYLLNIRGVVAAGTACTAPLFSAGVLICPANHACTGGTCQPL